MTASPRLPFCSSGHTVPIDSQATTLFWHFALTSDLAEMIGDDATGHSLYLLFVVAAPE